MIQLYNQGTSTPLYEVLEEIHPTNYWTYISPGVMITDKISVEISFKCSTNYNSAYPILFAGNANWDSADSMYCYYHQGIFSYKFIGETSNHYENSITTDNNDHVVYLSSSEVRYDGNIVGTRTPIARNTNCDLHIFLPAQMNNLEQGKFPTYYFKVWDNNVLIRDMVPAKRLSDNAIGMYDKQNKQFYLPTTNYIDYTSKSTPEYISEIITSSSEITSIKCGSTDICRIYNGGQLYFGRLSNYTYEVLEYIVLPKYAAVDTGLAVYNDMACEMTLELYGSVTSGENPRLFSNDGEHTYGPGGGDWSSMYTWGLQLEDGGTRLSVAPLGISYTVTRVDLSFSQIQGLKLRYNLTAAGALNIYNADGTSFFSTNVSSSTVPRPSSTNLCLFSLDTLISCESYAGSKFYNAKVWQGQNIVRNYIPVKRLADNVCGVYDTLNNTFQANEYERSSSYLFTGVSKATPEYF